jgi:hypothetical protein
VEDRSRNPRRFLLLIYFNSDFSNGKAHKRYEFGCKVSVTTTSKDNFVVGAQAIHCNSYDGHTRSEAVEHAERLGDFKTKDIYADQGYRGHNYEGQAKVHLARKGIRKVKPSLRHWLKRKSAIEPVIAHMKTIVTWVETTAKLDIIQKILPSLPEKVS